MSPERCPATWPLLESHNGEMLRKSRLPCVRLEGHLYDHMCKLPNGDLYVFPRHGGFL